MSNIYRRVSAEVLDRVVDENATLRAQLAALLDVAVAAAKLRLNREDMTAMRELCLALDRLGGR